MQTLIVTLDSDKELRLQCSKFAVVNEELHLLDSAGNMLACYAHGGWKACRWEIPPSSIPNDIHT